MQISVLPPPFIYLEWFSPIRDSSFKFALNYPPELFPSETELRVLPALWSTTNSQPREIVPFPWPIVKGRQHDWRVRYVSDVLEGSRCMVPFQWDHECLSISLFVGPLWENTTEIFLLLIFYSVFDSRKTYRVAFCLHTFIVCVYIQIYMYCLCVYI